MAASLLECFECGEGCRHEPSNDVVHVGVRNPLTVRGHPRRLLTLTLAWHALMAGRCPGQRDPYSDLLAGADEPRRVGIVALLAVGYLNECRPPARRSRT